MVGEGAVKSTRKTKDKKGGGSTVLRKVTIAVRSTDHNRVGDHPCCAFPGGDAKEQNHHLGAVPFRKRVENQ